GENFAFVIVPIRNWGRDDGEFLCGDGEDRNRERDKAESDEDFHRSREIEGAGLRLEGERRGIEAVHHAADCRDQVRVEHHARVLQLGGVEERNRSDDEDYHFDPEENRELIELECERNLAVYQEIGDAEHQPRDDHVTGNPAQFLEDVKIHRALPHNCAEQERSGNTGEAHERGGPYIKKRQEWRLPERVNPISGEEHQRAERRLVHRWKKICKPDDQRIELGHDRRGLLYQRPEVGTKLMHPLEDWRNILQEEREHGVERHADRDFEQRRVIVPTPRHQHEIHVPRAAYVDTE